jgi:hypothetical protein
MTIKTRKSGRKGLNPEGEGPSPKISFNLHSLSETKLRQFCRAYNINISDFIRQAIDEKIERELKSK